MPCQPLTPHYEDLHHLLRNHPSRILVCDESTTHIRYTMNLKKDIMYAHTHTHTFSVCKTQRLYNYTYLQHIRLGYRHLVHTFTPNARVKVISHIVQTFSGLFSFSLPLTWTLGPSESPSLNPEPWKEADFSFLFCLSSSSILRAPCLCG